MVYDVVYEGYGYEYCEDGEGGGDDCLVDFGGVFLGGGDVVFVHFCVVVDVLAYYDGVVDEDVYGEREVYEGIIVTGKQIGRAHV